MQRYDVFRHTSYTIQENVYGEFVKYSEAQATIARLTAERDNQYEMNAGLIAKQAETEAQLAEARAAIAAAYERAGKTAALAIANHRDGPTSMPYFTETAIRSLEPDATTALDRIVKRAVDAETRACAEVKFPKGWREEPTYKSKMVMQKMYSEGFNACRTAVLARIDQRKEGGE